MPAYIITYKKDISADEKEKLRQTIREQQGEITQEYTLIPAFAVKYPEGTIQTMDSKPNVERVEADGIVTTQ